MFKEQKIEQEKGAETKVVLYLMRHAEQESDKKFDKRKRLTEQGRLQADMKGEELKAQPEVALAVTSPRDRSMETAYRVMLAGQDEVLKDQSLEEIEKKIAEELNQKKDSGKIKKLLIDDRLDALVDGPLAKDYFAASGSDNFFDWAIKESDKAAVACGDEKTTTYTRAAGKIAGVVEKYTQVGSNFNKIAAGTDKYVKFGNQLERYLVSHNRYSELFLAKILEKVAGEAERDEFLESVKNGFGFTEGIKIEIANQDREQKITISYKVGQEDKNVVLGREVLAGIIQERQEFEEKIKPDVDQRA